MVEWLTSLLPPRIHPPAVLSTLVDLIFLACTIEGRRDVGGVALAMHVPMYR
jgi:hypothetical protein